MTLDLNNLSFGQYLKSTRLQRGIELEVIAKETRIGMDNLRYIESEAHDSLPAVAFVKGFLRAYAQALGVDAEDVVGRYEDSLRTEKSLAKGEAELVRLNQRFWPRLLISLSALVILMALSISVVSVSKNPLMRIQTREGALEKLPPSGPAPDEKDSPAIKAAPDDPYATQDTMNEPAATPEPAFKASGRVAEPAMSGSAPPSEHDKAFEPELDDVPLAEPDPRPLQTGVDADGLRLVISAHEETWLQVTIDNLAPKSYHLRPGRHLELEAATNFTLRVGNAGGVTLLLDDRQLPPLGRSGQVVTVRLP
jgi:cytoskeletal protein RodZ